MIKISFNQIYLSRSLYIETHHSKITATTNHFEKHPNLESFHIKNIKKKISKTEEQKISTNQ